MATRRAPRAWPRLAPWYPAGNSSRPHASSAAADASGKLYLTVPARAGRAPQRRPGERELGSSGDSRGGQMEPVVHTSRSQQVCAARQKAVLLAP